MTACTKSTVNKNEPSNYQKEEGSQSLGQKDGILGTFMGTVNSGGQVCTVSHSLPLAPA